MAEACGGSMMRLRSCIGPMVKGSKMRESTGVGAGVVLMESVCRGAGKGHPPQGMTGAPASSWLTW